MSQRYVHKIIAFDFYKFYSDEISIASRGAGLYFILLFDNVYVQRLVAVRD